MATGLQKSFNWDQVALSAVSAGVGDGLGGVLDITGSAAVNAALTGAAANAITQGIGVATGLQKSFNWAGVASAGVAAGVTAGVGNALGLGAKGNTLTQNLAFGAVSGGAGLIAGAATRSLIDGSDFGDNILSNLPTVGETIGNAIAGNIAQPDDNLSGQAARMAADGNQPADISGMTQTQLQPENVAFPGFTDADLQNMPLPEIAVDGNSTGFTQGVDLASIPVPTPRPDTGGFSAASAAGYNTGFYNGNFLNSGNLSSQLASYGIAPITSQILNVPTAMAVAANGVGTNDRINPFEIAGNMVDGQVVGTTALLKAFGTEDIGAAINGVDKALGPATAVLLVGQEIYQTSQDIKNGTNPTVAAVGATVNGAIIYGAGAVGTALTENPAGGVAASIATEHVLPSNATTGNAVLKFLGHALYGMLQD